MRKTTEQLKKVYSAIGSIVVEPVANYQVIVGNVFSTRQILTIPSGVSNVVFDATAAVDKIFVVLPPSFVGVGGNDIEISYYAGASYTGGTSMPATNRNQTSPKTSDGVLFFNPTITVPGSNGAIQWLIPLQASGQQDASGGAADTLPFVVDSTLVQRLEINNTDASSATLEVNFTWYEIPRGELIR